MHPAFPQNDALIYLNHAAVSPWPQCTVDAVTQFAHENLRQGAQQYPSWVRTEQQLRERLRWLVNAESTDSIALLKNTSEALSVIAYGLDWQAGDNVVLAQQEFPSNRIVWESLQRLGVECRIVDLAVGDDPEQRLIDASDQHTRLLTTSSVHYANGLRMNLQRLGEHCKQQNILFCVDAIQSLGAFPLDAPAIHADFVVADGHKWMLGPEGLALFYCRPEHLPTLQLYQYGWHMIENAGDYSQTQWQPAHNAQRFECGSPNMLGVHALNASIGFIQQQGLTSIATQIQANVDYLLERLAEIHAIDILSPRQAERRAGIVLFKANNLDNAKLQQHLLDNNVICAYRGGGIRLSPHFYNTYAQLNTATEIVRQKLLNKIA